VRVQGIETFTRGGIALVRVRTDDGAEGWGQTAPSNADITAEVLHRQIAPHVLGADATDLDGVSDRCIDRNHKFPWSYVCRALGGVDTALWDLRGKVEGKSVCELLGGRPRPLAAYGSGMRRDTTPDEEAARLARERETRGFSGFKIKIGTPCGHDRDAWPGRTEAVIPAVRKALGDDVVLLADANSCYTPGRAIEVGRILEANRYGHFEEPCPYWELEWTAEVAAALGIPVAGGEQDVDLAQWRRMIRMRAVDIVQPDVCYVGGLTRALRVARMAADAGMPWRAALGEPLPRARLHAPHARRHPERGRPLRVLHRVVRPARRPLRAGTGRPRREGRDPRRARLGRDDQSRMAGEGRATGERAGIGHARGGMMNPAAAHRTRDGTELGAPCPDGRDHAGQGSSCRGTAGSSSTSLSRRSRVVTHSQGSSSRQAPCTRMSSGLTSSSTA